MAVAIQTKGNSFTADKPRPWGPPIFSRTGALQQLRYRARWAALFGFASTNIAPEDKSGVKVAVLLNFFDELKRRVPVSGR